MGPSTLIDGQLRARDGAGLDETTLQWGRRLSSTDSSGSCVMWWRATAFNGAVDSHRRTGSNSLNTLRCFVVLQWGRRLSSTDRSRSARTDCTDCTLQWGRRLSSTDSQGASEQSAAHNPLQWDRRLSST